MSSSDWVVMSLRDAGVALIDCEHRTPPAEPLGFPYIAIPQMKDGHLTLPGARLISRASLIEWTRKAKPQAGDVVLSRRCNPGETAVVPEGLECALGQNLVLLRTDGSRVSPRFLRWLVRSPAWWSQVAQHINVGAVFDSLTCADIPTFRLPIPPLAEQERIAGVLGALDDKIKLNRRMNRTLESIARAIFKSWFIDVDSAPGATSVGMGTASGWPLVPFADTVEILSGGTPRTNEPAYWGGDVPWYSVADAPLPEDVFVLCTEKTISHDGAENSAAQVVPPLTTIISARGTVGKCALSGRPMAFNQSCFGLRPADGHGDYYTYFSTLQVVDQLRRSAHGSVFSTITRPTFAAAVVPLPPSRLVARFDDLVQPLMTRILLNVRESATLLRTRHALLPRLISGELHLDQVDDGARRLAG